MTSISFKDGKRFSVGLVWVNLSASDKRWKDEARGNPAARQNPVCILRVGRKQKKPFQFGLGPLPPDGGKMKNLPPPLALHVVNSLPKNFLGLFHIGSGWWVFGMNLGQILFDGDAWFMDELSARAHFEKLKDAITWESGDTSLEDIIKDFGDDREASEYWLSKAIGKNTADSGGYFNIIKKDSPLTPFNALVVLMALGLMAFLFREDFFPEMENTVPPRPSSILFPKTWEKAPLAKELFSSCEKGFEGTPFVENMWQFTNAVCQPQRGLAVYYKKAGEASYLVPPKSALVNLTNPLVAEKVVQHQDKFAPRKPEKLLEEREAVLRFKEFFRIIGDFGPTKHSLSVKKPEVKADGEPPVQVKAPFGVADFVVETAFPAECAEFFDTLPGTVVEKVNFTLSGVTISWTFSGKLHMLPR